MNSFVKNASPDASGYLINYKESPLQNPFLKPSFLITYLNISITFLFFCSLFYYI